MATPSKLLKLLDTELIRELIDLRISDIRKGLIWFDGSRKRRDNQFKVRYEFLVGSVSAVPLTNPKAPSVPVGLEDIKQYGVVPTSMRIHHCIYDHDKIDMRAPGGADETRWGNGLNEWVAGILAERMLCTKEMLLWEALSGSISYNSSKTKLIYTIDFNIPATHLPTLTGGDKWDAPSTANPLKNIEDWLALYEKDAGFLPNKIVMNRFTLNTILAVVKFGDLFNNKEIMPLEGFKQWLQSTSGEATQLEIYQGNYKDEDGNQSYMVSDGEVFMFNTDRTLLFEEVAAAENETSPGSYAAGPWSESIPLNDPKGVKIMAGENMLPVITNPNAAFKAITY